MHRNKLVGVLFAGVCLASATLRPHVFAVVSQNTREAQIDLKTALNLGLDALKKKDDYDKWTGKYDLKVSRGSNYWFMDFVFKPKTPGEEIMVSVYDSKRVVVSGGL